MGERTEEATGDVRRVPVSPPFGATLHTYVDERHLDARAVARYAAAFDAHPARLVVLEHFLRADVADRLSRFLAREALYRTEYGLCSCAEPVDRDTWERADDRDRFFRYDRLAGTAPEHVLSPNALVYVRVRHAFREDAMRSFFEAISGVPVGESDDFGSHAMRRGDFLRDHSDDNRNRRLALVLYLSPGWEPGAGGNLLVHDEHGGETVVRPAYNSLVVFDVLARSTHRVEPVVAGAGAVRLTIGGWYHRPPS